MEHVAVIGSRDYPNLADVAAFIEDELDPSQHAIVSGGARGVDSYTGELAIKLGFELVVFRPRYDLYDSRRAPLIRNTEIAQTADRCVAFWDGKSRGTMDCVRKFKQLGKRVEVRQSK